MKPRINVNRHNVQRFAWMQAMLATMGEVYAPPSIAREEGAFVLRKCTDLGLALRLNGKDGVAYATIPDTATDDEAEALLLQFIESLPEPKEQA
jgi:hypothetical protein